MPPHRPPLTAAGFAYGIRLILPLMPGVATYAMALGAFAAQKGMSLSEISLMNVLVYAGASQFVALEVWRDPLSFATAATMVGIAAAVNLRMILMGAALRPWLGGLPGWQIYPALYPLTDPGWLISLRYHGEGGRDWGVYLGASVVFYIVWMLATVPGFLLGAIVADPEAWALDLVMPAFFTVLLVPLWKGRRESAVWAIAGAFSLASWTLLGGYWFILCGALAGAVAGAFLPYRKLAPTDATTAAVDGIATNQNTGVEEEKDRR